MTNHKKPKRVKQKFYTAKGKDPIKAVSSDLLIQQSETSKSIKNYNTAGIEYDKRIYNKLVRNMEAQKVASQSNDADLKIKLKNYGDNLRNDLKKSVGKTRVTIPQNVQATPTYRPQSHQLNDNYIQPTSDQQHQTETLTGDGVTVLAEEPQATLIPTVEVNKAERKILSLVSNKKYQTKKPDLKTITRWAVNYARGDKAFVNKVLRTYFEEKGTSETRTQLREEAVKQSKYKTASKQLKLNKQIRAVEEERKKATTASIASKPPAPKKISQIAKNKIIREKIKNIPINENLTNSAKKRMVGSKLFTKNGISIEDLDKVIIARRKKK